MGFHVPVMAAAAVEYLVVESAGIYVDATAGGGGHSAAIMAALGAGGRLLAMDRDGEAVAEAAARLASFGDRVRVEQAPFSHMRSCCEALGIRSVHGVLFDLGVSSHQLDAPGRGFSFREQGPLDMRMDGCQGKTAESWLATADEREIARVIHEFGEERAARRIARSVVRRRRAEGLHSTEDLRRAVVDTHPAKAAKTLARVFQAVRIAVNDELGQLELGLDAAAELLAPGGRLVLLTYQSGEDRIIKRKLNRLIRGCICPPRVPVCVCGRIPSFRKILRRPLTATAEEVVVNPRARSARLRVFEKL